MNSDWIVFCNVVANGKQPKGFGRTKTDTGSLVEYTEALSKLC